MFRNFELAYGFGECYENGMPRLPIMITFVARVELVFPLLQQLQRGGGVAHFVAQIVRDAAIRVEVEEVLAQVPRKKPGGDRKILVMRTCQAAAILAGFD